MFQICKEIYPPFFCVPLTEMLFRRKNLYFTQRKANWKFNPLFPVYHIVFKISSSTRSPNLPLHLRDSNLYFVCIFNFFISFLFSHLSHSLSVHLPPTFTHQYQSCISSLYNFVHPPATLFDFTPIISLSPCPNTSFPCLAFGKQTQTHTIEHNFL